MIFSEMIKAFGAGDETDEMEVLCSTFFQHREGRGSTASGCQHGIQNDHFSVIEILREAFEVDLGFKSFFVSSNAVVGDGGFREELVEGIANSQSGSEDRNKNDGSGELSAGHLSDRCRDRDGCGSEIFGGRENEESCYIRNVATKFVRRAGYGAKPGKPVSDEGVVVEVRHLGRREATS
ncbi:MAG: hypothetical protein ACJAT3_000171 [Akkermansiaceae bacterium]